MCAFRYSELFWLTVFPSCIGHMVMINPVPFGNSTLNNSPLKDVALDSPKSEFPCKQREGVYDITKLNTIAAGTVHDLEFSGSATHGGGTCQLAVSMDHEPDRESVWKLIKVIEGGCPTREEKDRPDRFNFSIPTDFPNGRATFSWTWYNRIGQVIFHHCAIVKGRFAVASHANISRSREIYQNCAPIEVTGGSDSRDYFDTLPNLYIVNLPTTQCKTVENFDAIIPHPGSMTESLGLFEKRPAVGPACEAIAEGQLIHEKGLNKSVSNVDASVDAGSNQGSATSTQSSPSQLTAHTMPSVKPVPKTAQTSDAAEVLEAIHFEEAACSEGLMVCHGSRQYGLCDNGIVLWQPVAQGTSCVDGAIVYED